MLQAKYFNAINKIRGFIYFDKIFTFGNSKVFYRDRYDGGGRYFGQDFFKVFEFLDLKVSGNILEWCAGPGFIGFSIREYFGINSLTLFDINKKLTRIITKTIRVNKLDNVYIIFGSKINDILNKNSI